MTTDMITLKLEESFLKQIDSVVEKQGYQNRTEFIRNALREKVEEARFNEAIMHLSELRGKSKKNISEQELELVRKKAFEKMDQLH